MTHINSNYPLIFIKIISELTKKHMGLHLYIYHWWQFFWGEICMPQLKYDLQKYIFHITMEKTFLDLMAVLKIDTLSSLI